MWRHRCLYRVAGPHIGSCVQSKERLKIHKHRRVKMAHEIITVPLGVADFSRSVGYLRVRWRLAKATGTSQEWTSWKGSCCWCDRGNKSASRRVGREKKEEEEKEWDEGMDHFKGTCHFSTNCR